MTTIKNLFFGSFLAVVATVFTMNNVQAQASGNQQPAAVFTAVDSSEVWSVARIPATLSDGKHVLATHKKNRTQVVVVVRKGQIAQVGHQTAGASFKALTPNASPCISGGFCTTYQARLCYTMPWGACVCVCGGFLTSNTGRN